MLRCLRLWFVLIRKCTCINAGGVMWAMSDPVQHGVMLINPSTGNVTLNLYPLRPKASSKKLRENSIFFFTLLITTVFVAYNHSVTGEAVSSGPAPLGTSLLTA